MERFINILIVDDDKKNLKGLKEILTGGGNNVLLADSIDTALPILSQKEIGIILVNIDSHDFEGLNLLQKIKDHSLVKNIYKIVITEHSTAGAKMVRGINQGAVDYIMKPFHPNLIRAKIEVFKSLYFKDQRISELLLNIFPEQVLEDLNNTGKFSPKRVENGVVLFTDFEDFSAKAKNIKPISLLKKLEVYFTKFDEIMERYHLEKIKTIGDAYMALAGVTENTQEPALRACLAALEIRDFMENEKQTAIAMKREYWQIRVGLHMGPLVAGIIGTSKFNFDVWGDTVNIANRAEQTSHSGSITATIDVVENVNEFIDCEPRGEITIHKRGGHLEMFYLTKIRNEYCLYGEGKAANAELRNKCGLPTMDFVHMRLDIINRLKALLPDELVYHDISHTLNVEKAALRFARLEGIKEKELLLLQTAVLYHDAGFIMQYEDNEEFGVRLAEMQLPKFGYSEREIKIITNIIRATKNDVEPENILEQIMCDADHDYLGRPDYKHIANRLRQELENHDHEMNEEEWIHFQLNFLENVHRYHTDTAQNVRLIGKKSRIKELKQQLEKLTEEA